MKILAILNARAVTPSGTSRGYSADHSELPHPSPYAVSFVITAADASSDRFVAYVIDVRARRGEYSVTGPRANMQNVLALFSRMADEVCTGVVPGPLPHPPGGEPEFVVGPGAGHGHPAIAIAMIQHEAINSVEQLQVH